MNSAPTVVLDGSIGEGGGQILRSALALSLVTAQPFRLTRIRAGRRKAGLLRQHLTAVQAAVAISGARAEGAELGSGELHFTPGPVRGGSYRFSVGTAGSATLVLQAILPALLTADAPTTLELEGGTHTAFAPPFDFIDRVFLPLIRRMGPDVQAELERPGFYPAGGGRFRVTVQPCRRLGSIELLQRGAVVGRKALARVCNLTPKIAQRELAIVRKSLSWEPQCFETEQVRDAVGPGNVLTLELRSEQISELFSGFGRRDATAEQVATGVVKEMRAYLVSDAPVGPYLADQLLVPLALAGGGRFRTVRPTRHTLTNVEIIRAFIDIEINVHQETRDAWTIALGRPSAEEPHDEE